MYNNFQNFWILSSIVGNLCLCLEGLAKSHRFRHCQRNLRRFYGKGRAALCAVVRILVLKPDRCCGISCAHSFCRHFPRLRGLDLSHRAVVNRPCVCCVAGCGGNHSRRFRRLLCRSGKGNDIADLCRLRSCSHKEISANTHMDRI